jgi:hypothetical protein
MYLVSYPRMKFHTEVCSFVPGYKVSGRDMYIPMYPSEKLVRYLDICR